MLIVSGVPTIVPVTPVIWLNAMPVGRLNESVVVATVAINDYTPEGTISCGDYTPTGDVTVNDIVVGDKTITVKEISS